ncbi:hypothetical protein OSB04_006141 [Centaurea solstitialis]|uniref:Arginine decarboxylase n=1 Tax=Centaurea solstitialis TaxID=347529 RepID=A0AA38TSX2_9ASTR|nr:hypothetical protein OSB04_006141 [Centaurea solstitialis]
MLFFLYHFVGKKPGMPGKKQEKVRLLDNKKTVKDNTVISHSQDSEHHKHLPPVSALKASAEQNVARFHFPGHNGGRAAPSSLSSLIGVEPFLHDFTTTIPGLDNLSAPKGPILDAQKQAAKLFGATETWFLVGGTTCGIHASIMATCSPGDTLILPRNSHISAFSSMVLSGAIPKYVTPEYDVDWDIVCGITRSHASEVLFFWLLCMLCLRSACTTSLGIELIPSLCMNGMWRRQSENWTLKVEKRLQLSSSLLSRCCKGSNKPKPRNPFFNKAVDIALEGKDLIEKIPGITVLNFGTFSDVLGSDPLQITIGVWKLGISGFEADNILYEDYGVVSELIGTHSITFVINLGTSREDVLRLVSGFNHLSQTHNSIGLKEGKPNGILQPFIESSGGMRLSPRDAFFASKKKVSFEESIGRICGELICPYPPGIPLLIPGEVITEEAASYLVEVKKKGGFVTGAYDSSLFSIVVCS